MRRAARRRGVAAVAVRAAVAVAAACTSAPRATRPVAASGDDGHAPRPGALGARAATACRPPAAGHAPDGVGRGRVLDPDSADADADGLSDACEFAIARAFAPELVVDRRDCLWTDAPPAARLGGGYLFAARPVPGGVRVAYLPAYLRDCGWGGPVCRLRRAGCGAHDGDSELIVVDVARDTAASAPWRTTGVFLSAHCFGRSGGRCRWFRGRALDAFAWADGRPYGAPRVWVARGKHAHYPTRRACDRGHWSYDSCDRNTVRVRFPLLAAAQNVGSRARPAAPGGCVPAARLALGAGTRPGARECVWDASAPFRGWQGAASGPPPTPYAVVLARAAGF
jgi:hypothetical protein